MLYRILQLDGETNLKLILTLKDVNIFIRSRQREIREKTNIMKPIYVLVIPLNSDLYNFKGTIGCPVLNIYKNKYI